MLSFVLTEPGDALLPEVAINIPNESQVIKKLNLGLAEEFPGIGCTHVLYP